MSMPNSIWGREQTLGWHEFAKFWSSFYAWWGWRSTSSVTGPFGLDRVWPSPKQTCWSECTPQPCRKVSLLGECDTVGGYFWCLCGRWGVPSHSAWMAWRPHWQATTNFFGWESFGLSANMTIPLDVDPNRLLYQSPWILPKVLLTTWPRKVCTNGEMQFAIPIRTRRPYRTTITGFLSRWSHLWNRGKLGRWSGRVWG